MRILLIEDNIKVCESLSFQLKKEGFIIETSNDGEEGLLYVYQEAHDLILLDRMLPSLDGIKILKKARSRGISTPVILITALGELDDKIIGLDTGADDYLVKPFDFKELLARIKSISRRPRHWEGIQELSFGDITLADDRKQLSRNKTTCLLTKKEASLLEIFLTNPNQIIPRSIILSKVWGSNTTVEEGNIDNYIFLLRRKLKAVNSRLILKTIHRTGYRLEDKHVS